FQVAIPSVRVKLHDLSTAEMLAGLREGRLGLAFTVRPAANELRGLRFEEVMREPLCLAVAPAHPLASSRIVSLADAAREPFIAYSRTEYPEYHELLAKVFAKTKTRPRVGEEHDGVSSLISAVETGSGVALVPGSMSCHAGPRLKLLPLSPAPEALFIGAIIRKEKPDHAAEQFVSCARQVAPGK